MSYGDLSVFRAPLWTAAAHMVHFRPVTCPLDLPLERAKHWPRGTRLHNRGAENVSYMPEVLKHPKPSMIGIRNVQISAYEFERDARPSA